MSAPLQCTVGIIDASPDQQIRLTLTTEKGERVIDVRAFDRFAGVWMPTRSGVSFPVLHLAAFKALACAAADLEGGAA